MEICTQLLDVSVAWALGPATDLEIIHGIRKNSSDSETNVHGVQKIQDSKKIIHGVKI